LDNFIWERTSSVEPVKAILKDLLKLSQLRQGPGKELAPVGHHCHQIETNFRFRVPTKTGRRVIVSKTKKPTREKVAYF